jgi:hypothetical protein
MQIRGTFEVETQRHIRARLQPLGGGVDESYQSGRVPVV